MVCSLSIIMARKAPRAAILRRGPSRLVRLILWHTDTDELELGQWFRGMIYAGLSNLSPNGSLFVYVAEKWNKPSAKAQGYTNAWTAISRPPWLTALALWPAEDPYSESARTSLQLGGGLFLDNKTVRLNHPPYLAKPHPEHQPRGLKIVLEPANEEEFGRQIMAKRGWVRVQEAKGHRSRWGWVVDQPGILEKRNTRRRKKKLLLIAENGLRFEVRDDATGETHELEDVDWAEWDQAGRLIFIRECSLFAANEQDDVANAKLIGDFSTQKFEPIVAPDWATRW